MTFYAESTPGKTGHFAHAFIRENVVYGYDVRKFTVIKSIITQYGVQHVYS